MSIPFLLLKSINHWKNENLIVKVFIGLKFCYRKRPQTSDVSHQRKKVTIMEFTYFESCFFSILVEIGIIPLVLVTFSSQLPLYDCSVSETPNTVLQHNKLINTLTKQRIQNRLTQLQLTNIIELHFIVEICVYQLGEAQNPALLLVGRHHSRKLADFWRLF